MKEMPHQSIMSEWHAQYVQDVQCPGDCNLGRPCRFVVAMDNTLDM